MLAQNNFNEKFFPRKSLEQRKAAWRAKMKNERAQQEQRDIVGQQAQEMFMVQTCWQNSRVIALYMAIREETDTRLLLERAWAEGKTTLLPKVIAPGKMLFAPINSLCELVPGAFGIPEPLATQAEPYADLVVIPGLAFDSQGYRLGYGGGFYDRFFARKSDFAKIKVGLCFSRQVFHHIPHADHDIMMDAICTERGFCFTRINL